MKTPAWRVRQSRAGELLAESWVDLADDAPERPRRSFKRLFPEQAWERTPGLELAPTCDACGSVTVWRGRWECQGCAARGARLAPSLGALPSALPREALAGVPIFSSSEGNNSTARTQWLWAVESLTSFHRKSEASRRLWQGTRNTAETTDADGVVTPNTAVQTYVNPWHAARVKGQAERFERVAACGTFEHKLTVTLDDGTVKEAPIASKCDCWRVCQRCLNRRKYKLQQGMVSQRALAVQRFYRQTHKRYRGKEGKWSEKLITFTVPHGDGGPAQDARVLVDAWQLLLRRIRNHLVARGAYTVSAKGKRTAVSVPWCRALEVAPGDSGGHAHLHVWWMGPFVDVVLLRAWWGGVLNNAKVGGVPTRTWESVLGAGRDRRLASWLGNPSEHDLLPWPVVDIRTGGNAAALYTQKVGVSLYITKGTETLHLSPAHAASVYETFEGTRAVQWARGWAPPKKPLRARCVSFRRLTEEEKAILNHSGIHRITKARNANANQGLDTNGTGNVGRNDVIFDTPGAYRPIRADGSDAPPSVGFRPGGKPGPNEGLTRQLSLAIDIRKSARTRKSW